MNFVRSIQVAALVAAYHAGAAESLDDLCADRAAIERVYHEHRTGAKPPFEQALPRATIERFVRDELKKEAVLQRAYGMRITDALVQAEVARINATTRAPEMLAEIKAALGNDPARFARSVARPIVVERALRARFENDDALHAPQRRLAEQARAQLLAARHERIEKRIALLKANAAGESREVTWKITPRPESDKSAIANQQSAIPAAATKNAAKVGPYTVEATAQIAQVIASPDQQSNREADDYDCYFEDLSPELQNVLRAQLKKSGDVSAVIETPTTFLLFLTKERTATALGVGSLAIPKRSYEEWLAQQEL